MNLLLDEEKCYLIHGFLQNWRAELKKMNKGKEGANYRYPNSLILLLATVHAYLLPYRQLEGFLRMMSEHMKRLQKIVPGLHNNMVESSKDKDKPGPKSKPRKRRYSNSSG